MRLFYVFLASILAWFSSFAHAELLPAHQAFKFSVSSQGEQAVLKWDIQPNYYLYQQRFAVQQNQQAVALKLPQGTAQYDENFGHSQVYWNKVQFSIKTEPNQNYRVTWQGCAKDQLCYAPQHMEFSTDAQGKVQTGGLNLKKNTSSSPFLAKKPAVENVEPALQATDNKTEVKTERAINNAVANKTEQNVSKAITPNQATETANTAKSVSNKNEVKAETTSNQTTDKASEKTAETTAENKALTATALAGATTATVATLADEKAIADTANDAEPTAENKTNAAEQTPVEPATTTENSQAITSQNQANTANGEFVAQDQKWFNQLQQSSIGLAVLLFLGLGILLAFTPCSLPMIPILSSLIVRKQQGAKAWLIALVFVLSMATVYAVLGFIASSAGLGLQRWLQQPITLIAFSILFVIFAFNLFGAFELQLPQFITRRLDRWQSAQQGGTLVSAGIMGALSALFVGPCMTAPLAGVLLFIAQTEHQWQGALLLFALGFGMGIPLLLFSVLGAKVLPKAGEWMVQVKVIFGFIMLALAIYFLRPMLAEMVYVLLWVILVLTVVYHFSQKLLQATWLRTVLFALCATVIVGVAGYYFIQPAANAVQQNEQAQTWLKVQNKQQLQQALAQAKQSNQTMIIDVYADWCTSCQPIERMFKQADVQAQLQGYFLIKLDLSQNDPSHQALLDELDVLGPPTLLFLNAQGQEYRDLRLTGAFEQAELEQRLSHLLAK
ncbi:MAG: protein-disulfide reductase DsbD [Acinetobacter sp.]|nr:protein-disulfide reductase DsbD [Acinetobacter sp.]